MTRNDSSSSCTRLALLYKAFYFVFYAGYISFLLYVPVYFKYLGLNAVHVGILNGIRPLMQAIGAPLWGIVGDRYRIRKPIFLIAFVLMTAKTTSFLAFRPHNHTCIITRYDSSHRVLDNSTYIIRHDINKRANKLLGEANGLEELKTRRRINFVASSKPAPGKLSGVKAGSKHVPGKKSEGGIMTDYTKIVDEAETFRIFIAITILIVVGEVFDAAAFTMADTSCLETLGGENYGFYRLWGSIGWGIMTPLIGLVINYFAVDQCGEHVGAYFCIFYFYVAFMYMSLLFGSHFEFKYELRDDIQKTVKNALLNFHYGIFLFVTFYAGFCYGFLLYFVNLFIDDLGGTATIMGAATACKSVVDVLLFFLSEKIIHVFGHLNSVTVSLVAYIGAFLSYSYITNPWYALPIEVLHSGAYALVWSSSVSYLNQAAPAGSSATVQGILQGVYWGLGTGGGTIIGGYIVHVYGFLWTFRSFAVTTTVILIMFILTQLISKLSSIQDEGEVTGDMPGSKDEVVGSHEENKDAEYNLAYDFSEGGGNED